VTAGHVLAFEIAIDDRQNQTLERRVARAVLSVTNGLVVAVEAIFGAGAIALAAIAVERVAVIALFVARYVAVAADRRTTSGVVAFTDWLLSAGLGATTAIAKEETIRSSAPCRQLIWIVTAVTSFSAIDLAVTADGLNARSRARAFARVTWFLVTGDGTTVPIIAVAVVALSRAYLLPVATLWNARLARHAALPPVFDLLAVCRATVATALVAVVASFLAGYMTVAARGQ
jgi:hypothetical protein